MMATPAARQKAKAKDVPRLSDQGFFPRFWLTGSHVDLHAEVQSNYTRLQGDLQALASKIGELESEAEEHECVSASRNPT